MPISSLLPAGLAFHRPWSQLKETDAPLFRHAALCWLPVKRVDVPPEGVLRISGSGDVHNVRIDHHDRHDHDGCTVPELHYHDLSSSLTQTVRSEYPLVDDQITSWIEEQHPLARQALRWLDAEPPERQTAILELIARAPQDLIAIWLAAQLAVQRAATQAQNEDTLVSTDVLRDRLSPELDAQLAASGIPTAGLTVAERRTLYLEVAERLSPDRARSPAPSLAGVLHLLHDKPQSRHHVVSALRGGEIGVLTTLEAFAALPRPKQEQALRDVPDRPHVVLGQCLGAVHRHHGVAS